MSGARCKHGHELTEENVNVAPSGKRRCRECVKRYNQKSYAKADPVVRSEKARVNRLKRLERDPDYEKRAHNKRMKAYIADRVLRWDEYRATLKCERCGFDDGRALDFHHRDPSQKKFTIGYMVRRFPLEDCMAEMAKCEVLCCNCHRIEHHKNLPPNRQRPYIKERRLKAA